MLNFEFWSQCQWHRDRKRLSTVPGPPQSHWQALADSDETQSIIMVSSDPYSDWDQGCCRQMPPTTEDVPGGHAAS